jgi:flagellar motor protein MotB
VEDFTAQEAPPSVQSKPKALTAANLAAETKSQAKASSKAAPSVASKKKKGPQKPAWAQTETQLEEAKEAEIDDLLEFAYELDYEKYMEDYEVRQALAIIKDRVNELTEKPDWKEQMAEEWNQANAEEAAARRERRAADSDNRSQVTYRKSNRHSSLLNMLAKPQLIISPSQ